MQSLGGIAFEAEVSSRLSALGWDVRRTAVTGDFGADIVAKIAHESLVIQCKDYGSPAGVSAVQEVFYAKTHYQATAAIVVARNGFTRAAIEAAERARIILLRPQDIKSGCTLDRRQRRHDLDDLRRKQEEAETNRKHREWMSKEWRRYDAAAAAWRRMRRTKRATRVVFLMAATAWLGWTAFSHGSLIVDPDMLEVFFKAASLCAVVWFLFLRDPKEPAKPAGSRKGAIITCDICRQRLRVDYGKTGSVRCPQCTALVAAKT